MLTNSCRPVDYNTTTAVLGLCFTRSFIKWSFFYQASYSELSLKRYVWAISSSFPCQKHFRTTSWAARISSLLLQFICVWIAVNFWSLGFHFTNGKLDIESQIVTWENGHITDRNAVYGWRLVSLVVNSCWFTVRRLHLIIECTLWTIFTFASHTEPIENELLVFLFTLLTGLACMLQTVLFSVILNFT